VFVLVFFFVFWCVCIRVHTQTHTNTRFYMRYEEYVPLPECVLLLEFSVTSSNTSYVTKYDR
jgi:hypothetical protein